MEEAGIRVVFPTGNRQRLDFALADFGEAKYGGSMIGVLHYPSSDKDSIPTGQQPLKCYPEDCQYACKPFNVSETRRGSVCTPGHLGQQHLECHLECQQYLPMALLAIRIHCICAVAHG